MSWQHIVVVVLLTLSALASIALVVEERKPLTGGKVAISTAINAAIIYLIIVG